MTPGSVAPITWFGGKQRLAPEIVRLLPSHKVYVEVFGGGGSVLFHKPAAKLDVYNDVNDGLVNFFRVLRDRPGELQETLRLTPYARAEYIECSHSWQGIEDPLEKARRWFVTVTISFMSQDGKSRSWKAGTAVNHADQWADRVETLMKFANRLRRVQVDLRTWSECLAIYDSPDTVFYCDPPYLPSTRKSGEYRHEMTRYQHEKFLAAAIAIKGSMLVSGYDSSLYRQKLEVEGGFERYEYDIALQATLHTQGSTRDRRIEVIWRKAPHELRLFDTLP